MCDTRHVLDEFLGGLTTLSLVNDIHCSQLAVDVKECVLIKRTWLEGEWRQLLPLVTLAFFHSLYIYIYIYILYLRTVTVSPFVDSSAEHKEVRMDEIAMW